MNLFYFNEDPENAAKDLDNQRLVKMVLETAQLLCTAHRVLDGVKEINERGATHYRLNDHREDRLYKATHVNHPVSIWARTNSANYRWLYLYFKNLAKEYEYRYNRIHKSFKDLGLTLFVQPVNIEESCVTTIPALAMPEKYKKRSAVEAYRDYYYSEKYVPNYPKLKWTGRQKPEWITRRETV